MIATVTDLSNWMSTISDSAIIIISTHACFVKLEIVGVYLIQKCKFLAYKIATFNIKYILVDLLFEK